MKNNYYTQKFCIGDLVQWKLTGQQGIIISYDGFDSYDIGVQGYDSCHGSNLILLQRDKNIELKANIREAIDKEINSLRT